MASQVPPEVSEPIAAAARDAGVDVYHAELSGRELRVQVESPSGASVRTCSDFTRALAARLDEAGFLHRQYALEVSTPGVERRLYEPADYGKAINRQVRLRTREGLFEGRLLAAGPAGVTVRVEAGPVPAPRDFAYADIREAQIRVSDSELFARRPAEDGNPKPQTPNPKGEGESGNDESPDFGISPSPLPTSALAVLAVLFGLLLRLFGERTI